jgi:16S rRNA (adenine1518-N6/adenine1519-N6)-dimethyltransferase
MTLENLQRLLKKYNLKANHTLGQHFLLDDTVLDQMIASAGLVPVDTVLEVGPGIGNLTSRLAQTGARVVAVEKDRSFRPLLAEMTTKYTNVELHFADILRMNIGELLGSTGRRQDLIRYKVVANLPYYLTGVFMQRVLRELPRPSSITVLIQREVAENMVAGPGHMNLLALSVQLMGIPRIVTRVPAQSFFPAPKVESAVVVVDIPNEPLYPGLNNWQVFRVAKACFLGKRKQIHNTLEHNLGLSPDFIGQLLHALSLSPATRPQALRVQDFIALAEHIGAVSSVR